MAVPARLFGPRRMTRDDWQIRRNGFCKIARQSAHSLTNEYAEPRPAQKEIFHRASTTPVSY